MIGPLFAKTIRDARLLFFSVIGVVVLFSVVLRRRDEPGEHAGVCRVRYAGIS